MKEEKPKLSRYARNKRDTQISKELSKINKWACAPYIIIPWMLFIVGGQRLGVYTFVVWFFYSIALICLFNRKVREYSCESNRIAARIGNAYIFYQLAWFFLIAMSLFFISMISGFFGF